MQQAKKKVRPSSTSQCFREGRIKYVRQGSGGAVPMRIGLGIAASLAAEVAHTTVRGLTQTALTALYAVMSARRLSLRSDWRGGLLVP